MYPINNYITFLRQKAGCGNYTRAAKHVERGEQEGKERESFDYRYD